MKSQELLSIICLLSQLSIRFQSDGHHICFYEVGGRTILHQTYPLYQLLQTLLEIGLIADSS